MQFKFDANQEYQIKAVEAAVNLLEGQQRISGASVFVGMGDAQTALLPPEQRGQTWHKVIGVYPRLQVFSPPCPHVEH